MIEDRQPYSKTATTTINEMIDFLKQVSIAGTTKQSTYLLGKILEKHLSLEKTVSYHITESDVFYDHYGATGGFILEINGKEPILTNLSKTCELIQELTEFKYDVPEFDNQNIKIKYFVDIV